MCENEYESIDRGKGQPGGKFRVGDAVRRLLHHGWQRDETDSSRFVKIKGELRAIAHVVPWRSDIKHLELKDLELEDPTS